MSTFFRSMGRKQQRNEPKMSMLARALQVLAFLLAVCGGVLYSQGQALAQDCEHNTDSAECYKKGVVYPQMTRNAELKDQSDQKAEEVAGKQGSPVNKYARGNSQFLVSHLSDFNEIMRELLPELANPFMITEPLNSCMAYHSDYQRLCLYKNGCDPLIRITPSAHYRYPVDKVETARIPFNTRYAPTVMVQIAANITKSSLPDPVNYPLPLQVQVERRIIDSVNRNNFYAKRLRGKKADLDYEVPLDTVPVDERVINEMTSRDALKERNLGTYNDAGARQNEYHAVPEMFSRILHKTLEENGTKNKIVLYLIECKCGSFLGIFGGISCTFFGPVNLRPLCHNQKDAVAFWGSEFPGPFGGYTQTRLPWWIAEDQKLEKYREAYNTIRKDPFYCAKMDKVKGKGWKEETYGYVPPDVSSQRLIPALDGEIPEDERDGIKPGNEKIRNPCLPNGLGPYIPFRNFTRASFGTVAAEVGFVRGEEMSYVYNPDLFYSWQPNGSSITKDDAGGLQGDKVQWISKDSGSERDLEMPNGCVDPDWRFDRFTDTKNGGKAGANLDYPDDFPRVGVQWREFLCCREGEPLVAWDENKG